MVLGAIRALVVCEHGMLIGAGTGNWEMFGGKT